jgi:hypothetical protein
VRHLSLMALPASAKGSAEISALLRCSIAKRMYEERAFFGPFGPFALGGTSPPSSSALLRFFDFLRASASPVLAPSPSTSALRLSRCPRQGSHV